MNDRHESAPTSPTRRAGLALACALLCLSAAPHRPQDGARSVEDTRALLEKWVETRRILSKEKSDWVLGRELLEERSEVVLRELETLRTRMREAEESIAEADRKRAQLLADNQRLAEAAGALGTTVLALETRTRELLLRLPDSLRERVKPLSQRLPAAADGKLSMSERFQNVVGLVNEVDKFQREISATSEVRTLPDGTAAEVTALYVGLGQAYYVGSSGALAGTGRATADGWAWTPANEAAVDIAAALAIFRNERVAEFVPLPVRID